ncbi:MAG: hypothetical protein HXY46_16300 [Syntrophaceae bacterium]|nr:hypothetical protein [Syntrophaceae bacterium]
MVQIELKPTFSTCVETLSKKEYERTLRLLLKRGPADERLAERLEILRLFLESADFASIRSQYEGYLTEGKQVTLLIFTEEGRAVYKLLIE